MSTSQLIALLAEAAGRRARLLPIPSGVLRAAGAALGQRGNVRRLLDSLAVDDSAIRAALGWRPALGLAEGLGAMVRGRPRR